MIIRFAFSYFISHTAILLSFSYRFMDLFPDAEMVRDVQKELDALIEEGIVRLTVLLSNSGGGKCDSFENLIPVLV